MTFLSLQLPCVHSAMLPGYGYSPFLDFQPHLHSFRCRGESPSMWIPASAESQALSEVQEERPLLQRCHHKHVAVCQQETLAFIELQPQLTPRLNGLGSQRPTLIHDAHCLTNSQPECLNGFRHSLNELNDIKNGFHRTDTGHESTTLNSHTHNSDLESQSRTEKPLSVSTQSCPSPIALSLPLSFPLSSLYTNRDSWESQLPFSPSSPEGPICQSPNSCQPQRRTSQGSLKEKSISECLLKKENCHFKTFFFFAF